MNFAGELAMETGPMRDIGGEEGDDGGALRLRTPPVNFESALEPMTRCRSNTWPCRPNDSVVDEETRSTPTSVDGDQTECMGSTRDPTRVGNGGSAVGAAGTRKAAARRNAWGNLSYADLITRAIESSPEKRLTLSQIYSWMVENVPFFKDKGDSNSSAGWKNSIRHNLSLHSRFMRVQNESTGKSSWWVINPDVKHLKTPRRRAATMDNTKEALQHRRNRLKGGGLSRVSSSEHPLIGYAYDSSSDHLDAAREHISSEMLSLASQNYRVRSSSNASSIGRLSPIPATAEQDVEETQFGIPLPSSALSWKGLCLPSESCTETLSESLASIFVEDVKKPMLVGDPCHGNIMVPDTNMAQNGNIMTQNGNIMAQNGNVMAPNGSIIPQNRGSILSPTGVSALGQNGGNIMVQNGSTLGHNRSILGQNGSIMGLPQSYSHSAVGMERSGGVPLALGHRMWPVYRAQQSSNVFSSTSLAGAGDASSKIGMYDGDTRYSAPALSHSGMVYYNDNSGRSVGGLCRSSSEVGYPQFGISNINNSAGQYGSPALNELLKKEPQKPMSCFYSGSNGDSSAGATVGMIMGMSAPLPGTLKVEQPAGPFPGERCKITQWQEQQQQQQPKPPQQPPQQQQQPARQLGLGRSLGPIDPRKLMKILAEKPHLKEKMLQLIQQKRQQLTLQQQQQQLSSSAHRSGTPPRYLSATAVPRLADSLQPKQPMADQEDSISSRPPATSAVLPANESMMPVDLDLDFDATPAINCDIDQVIQHELTFGELDFSLDQLQVTLSGSDMDCNSFHF